MMPAAAPASSPVAGRRVRLDSVDALRGAVMILMALDHVRDFFSRAHFPPTDLARTDGALFFTRWVTHFCAPVFVFLAGTGGYLSAARGKPRGALSRFLLTRGLWLVLLELTAVHVGWSGFDWMTTPVQVIWAIGWSMVAMAALVWLPLEAVAAVGLGMIAAHNLTDSIPAARFGSLGVVWTVLHQQGSIALFGGRRLMILYPLVPWMGVMATGYAFGAVLVDDPRARRRRLLAIGLSAIGLFAAIRGLDRYGDPAAWTQQRNGFYTFLSFLNCTKYPPSLDYLLMTLGPALLALGLLTPVDGVARPPRWLGPLVVFGRVPLFYYLLHVPLIHLGALLLWQVQLGRQPTAPFFRWPDEYGLPLGAVYAVWAVVVVGLYPLCRWYAGVKARSRSPWLSYL